MPDSSRQVVVLPAAAKGDRAASLGNAFSQIAAALQADPRLQDVHAQLDALRNTVENEFERLRGLLQRQTEQLHQLALTDHLTGLPNRAMLLDRIAQCMKRKRRDKSFNFAVLSLDFDRFKVINDSLGHAAGDLLLKSIANRLSAALRITDTVARPDVTAARLGGDEFVVLLEALHEDRDAVVVAQRLLETLAMPHQVQDHELFNTTSIGIVTATGAYTAPDQMLRDADNALYRAKAAGKNRFVIFDEKMHDQAMQRLDFECDLRRAIENREFFLQYQPINNLYDGTLIGFEALLRWRHAKLGVVPPDAFIPIAEETGLIIPIGRWVLYEAGRQLAEWKRQFPGTLMWVSVNLSKKQLATPDLVRGFMQSVQEAGVAPGDLRLEITESLIVEDAAAGLATVRSLKDHGFLLLMDDFGTGLSSLSLLHQFPLSGLKIDRAFIRNVNDRREYAAVISAIVILAHNLGLSVTAEGVETQEQLQMLQALDCDTAQGYFFSRPLGVEQATAFISMPPKTIAA